MAEAEKVMGVSADDIEKIMGVEVGDIEKIMGVEIPSGGWFGTRHLAGGGNYYHSDAMGNMIYSNIIVYKSSTSNGDSADFGNLTRNALHPGGAVSNISRAMWGGSQISGSTYQTDTLDYVTVGSTGNASDFGDNSTATSGGGASGNGILGFFFLGFTGASSPSRPNWMGYVTIATTGNASDAGDMQQGLNYVGSWSGTTYGGSWGGNRGGGGTGNQTNEISYIAFHTSNNASDFGDISTNSYAGTVCASEVRAVGNLGLQYETSLTEYNNIEYITVASTGDASDFGDLIGTYDKAACMSDGTRGEWWAGEAGGYSKTEIQSITVASTGNATDRGNTFQAYIGNGGVSGT